ncbi:PREDICTED: uncharacterized protein LOC108762468 [Trachymyrmex cornetzi]|uniref:uncharacterized protein LOC108762468 n=1 Tax=Trachymyrmex cornetzi TaxID=471704 RepID=UPI00084F54F6|nr:PREDICTED: uncharacterized protein LOC108762468 [Trachymyrmex cornetzi]
MNCNKRSKESFESREQPQHHKDHVDSVLLKLPGFDIINSVVIDSMHLLYLDVMKTLLEKWFLQKEDLSKLIHLIPCSWIFSDERGVVCKYPDHEDYQKLPYWVASLQKADKKWNSFSIEVMSYASTYKQGKRRLKCAYTDTEIRSTDCENASLNKSLPIVLHNDDLGKELDDVQSIIPSSQSGIEECISNIGNRASTPKEKTLPKTSGNQMQKEKSKRTHSNFSGFIQVLLIPPLSIPPLCITATFHYLFVYQGVNHVFSRETFHILFFTFHFSFFTHRGLT